MRRMALIVSAVAVVAALAFTFAHRSPPPDWPAASPAPHVQAVPAAAVSDAASSARLFTFRRIIMNTAGDAPEICLKFSTRLDPRAEAHYADYVAITPAVRPSIQATDQMLCVGGLAYGTDYTITLKRGLPSEAGERLAADETMPVTLGDRPPLVDISGDGFILPREVAHGLTIQTVNVQRVRIHVLRISDRLLPSATRRGDNANVQLTQSGLWGYAIRSLLQNTASIIWTGTMDVAPDHNRTVLTAFPLSQVIKPGMLGAYLVVAEDDARATPEAKWKEDDSEGYSEEFYRSKPSHWVIATDIALTTFTGSDGMHVSARSLAEATPKSGVVLDLLSVGQDVLGEATTDEDGMAHFAPGLLRGQGAASAGSITAHARGGDFTLLDLSRPAFDFSDRGVTGRPSPAPLQAFLYTERGIYRPGQNVELMALLRDRLGDATDLPLTLVLRRPNGMEARRFSQSRQPGAGFHQTIPLSATAARGTWSVDALADPAGAAIGRVTFEVQDFVPQQLKVKLAPIAAALTPGEKLPIDVQGDFLYGAPAAGLHGQADLRVTRDPAPVAAAPGWQFGLADETVDDKTQTVDLPPADASGHTHADATLDLPSETLQSPLKVVINAGLFEPSGREVSDSVEAKLRMRPILIGLHTHFADARADTEQDASIDIRCFAPDGTPIARPGLVWRLVEEQRIFDWFNEDNGWHFHYHVQDRDVAQGSVDVPQQMPTTVTRRYEWGNYRLIVEDTDTNTASSIRFSAGWGETAGQADVPDKVHVAVDKPILAAGETTKLHIEGPFAGHASVVIANDRVIETREIDVAKGGNDIAVTQSPEWGAGAYVLVSLYRPLREGSAHEPVRAVGLAWIATDAAPRTLAVDIAAPDKVRPQLDVTVPLHIGNIPDGDQAFVTLAAVDEGILQLTRFASPDPVGFLFGKRALGIAMRDDYGKLLDGSADPGQIQGGDEGIGGAGLPVVSTRTVALFNGPVTLDASGNASVVLKPGDFEGQLRLMAVAYTAHAVGQAQRTMIVRDPVVADVAVPRFLAAGDSASLAVSLDDTDGPAGRYQLDIAVSGAAHLDQAATGQFSEDLKPGQRISRAIEVSADAEGVADIAAALTGPDGLQVHRTWQAAVRSAHAPVTLEQTAWQQKGESFAIDKGLLLPFVPGSVSVSLGYSAFGGIDVPSLLQSLYRYPYGCTEQLTSTAFPLVYYNDPALLGTLPRDQGVHDRVQEAIDTILDRQDDSGEFGLWRVGDGEASTWLGVYALDFLTHAKEAGFNVPESALERSATWLRRAAEGNLEHSAYQYYEQGSTVTRAYADYVLARLGRADLGDLRRLHDTVQLRVGGNGRIWLASGNEELEPLALGQMAGAFSLMGDHPRAHDAFHMAIDNLTLHDWPRWWFDWSYASPLRDVAGLIAVAAETGQDDALAPLLNRFGQVRRDPASLNTQEQAALLAAAHALNKGAGPLTFLVNGSKTTTGSTPSFSPSPASIADGYSVSNESGRELWRTLSVTGSPREASPALSAGYSIDKNYYTLTGDKLDPAHLRQNDRIIVELHGFMTGDDASHRTVIVDLLPAGWEIEAPIGTTTEYGFLGPISDTRVREARDDRFVAAMDFGSDLRQWRYRFEEVNDDKAHLRDNEFRVAYVARAITPGHFTLPEAVVQDMYRPAFMARTGAAVTEVAKR
jgi:alpha-2-macroglobulin